MHDVTEKLFLKKQIQDQTAKRIFKTKVAEIDTLSIVSKFLAQDNDFPAF